MAIVSRKANSGRAFSQAVDLFVCVLQHADHAEVVKVSNEPDGPRAYARTYNGMAVRNLCAGRARVFKQRVKIGGQV